MPQSINCIRSNIMVETSTIFSPYFGRRFAIHERNIHVQASQGKKEKWFVYVAEDTYCGLIYVGSTVDVCARWAQTKKNCLDEKNTKTSPHIFRGRSITLTQKALILKVIEVDGVVRGGLSL